MKKFLVIMVIGMVCFGGQASAITTGDNCKSGKVEKKAKVNLELKEIHEGIKGHLQVMTQLVTQVRSINTCIGRGEAVKNILEQHLIVISAIAKRISNSNLSKNSKLKRFTELNETHVKVIALFNTEEFNDPVWHQDLKAYIAGIHANVTKIIFGRS